jgi:hypothetical protein
MLHGIQLALIFNQNYNKICANRKQTSPLDLLRCSQIYPKSCFSLAIARAKSAAPRQSQGCSHYARLARFFMIIYPLLNKFGGTSAIKASFMAFGLHKF